VDRLLIQKDVSSTQLIRGCFINTAYTRVYHQYSLYKGVSSIQLIRGCIINTAYTRVYHQYSLYEGVSSIQLIRGCIIYTAYTRVYHQHSFQLTLLTSATLLWTCQVLQAMLDDGSNGNSISSSGTLQDPEVWAVAFIVLLCVRVSVCARVSLCVCMCLCFYMCMHTCTRVCNNGKCECVVCTYMRACLCACLVLKWISSPLLHTAQAIVHRDQPSCAPSCAVPSQTVSLCFMSSVCSCPCREWANGSFYPFSPPLCTYLSPLLHVPVTSVHVPICAGHSRAAVGSRGGPS